MSLKTSQVYDIRNDRLEACNLFLAFGITLGVMWSTAEKNRHSKLHLKVIFMGITVKFEGFWMREVY